MGKITFIGDPRGGDNPATCEMFGITFPLNVPVEVDDEAHFAKLARNSHFTAEESEIVSEPKEATVDLQTIEDDIARVLQAEKALAEEQTAAVQEYVEDEVEAEPEPPRRKRGRPRKKPLPDEG